MKKRAWIFLLCVVLAVAAAFALSQRLQVTHYAVSSEKLPRNAVLAVVSDLHNSTFGRKQKQLALEIQAAEPDAVLLLGDMAESLADMNGVCTLIEALNGKYPVYYVSGNHECASGELEEIKATLRAMNVKVLEGETEMLACGVRIAGVDDVSRFGRRQWHGQLENCRSADNVFTVLLSHRPEQIQDYTTGFDLVLCGHAHGGQLRIPGILENGLWAPNQGFFPKYGSGMHPAGEGSMIISRGLARSALPRLFNRPELVIVQLQAQ